MGFEAPAARSRSTSTAAAAVSALHFSWTETPSFWAGRDEMRLMVTGVTEMFSYRQNMKMYRSGVLRYGEPVLFGANLA